MLYLPISKITSKSPQRGAISALSSPGTFKQFLYASGLFHWYQTMIQILILPEGCKSNDFERASTRQHPPINFVPTKSSTPKGLPVKMKISKELNVSILAFNGGTGEQYVKLIEDFKSIVHSNKSSILYLPNFQDNKQESPTRCDKYPQFLRSFQEIFICERAIPLISNHEPDFDSTWSL